MKPIKVEIGMYTNAQGGQVWQVNRAGFGPLIAETSDEQYAYAYARAEFGKYQSAILTLWDGDKGIETILA